MTTNTVSQVGLIGVSDTQVWKAPSGVTPGSDGDATAPFALGATVTGVAPQNAMQFCRIDGYGLTVGGNAAITNGVANEAGATTGNTWTNETGVELVEGDYVWLTGSIAVN